MICDFPAIYAKICDEISALPPCSCHSVYVYWTATVSCLFKNIYVFSAIPPRRRPIFMRCERDVRAPKNLQRKLACKNVDGKYLPLNGGRWGLKKQLPRFSICLTNLVDCLWHLAAVNWIRKVKGKQPATEWNGLGWDKSDLSDSNEILYWLIYRKKNSEKGTRLARGKVFEFVLRNRKSLPLGIVREVNHRKIYLP